MMKLKFLATGIAPDKYTFQGETLTVYFEEEEEAINFAPLKIGDRLHGVEFEKLNIDGLIAIRDATRDEYGQLNLILCQEAGEGNWTESDWMSSDDYEPGKKYIVEVAEDGEIVDRN